MRKLKELLVTAMLDHVEIIDIGMPLPKKYCVHDIFCPLSSNIVFGLSKNVTYVNFAIIRCMHHLSSPPCSYRWTLF